MKKCVMLGVVAVSAALAAPSSAGAYIEGRVGIAGGTYLSTTETIGAAIGFEVIGASGTSFGAEFVADTDADFFNSVGGVNLRAGTAVDEKSRVFVTLGRVWQREYFTYFDGIFLVTVDDYVYDTVAGGGFQTDISPNSYFSVQYQHAFDLDINRAMVGIGLKF